MGLTRAQLQTIATRTGYPVRAAWVAGHGAMGSVVGVVMHHTATAQSAAGDYPSLTVVTRGRPGLAGPLANFGLGRSGTIYLITEGIAWHAGVGSWKGITDGNGHFLGIEAEHPGIASVPWPAAQSDAYRRLVASILAFLGKDTNWDVRHADWAEPPGRKVDFIEQPALTGVGSMTSFDGAVRSMLANPASINKNWKPTPAPAPAPKPTPAPAPAPAVVKSAGVIQGALPLLTYGMRDPIRYPTTVAGGNYVKRLQALLIQFGYSMPIDGIYGAGTAAAVKTMNAKLLRRTVDGRSVDATTWRRLYGMV